MAMTKAERAALEAAKAGAAMARALRFPTDSKPKAMTKDEIERAMTSAGKTSYGSVTRVARGWFQNSHSMRVTHGCSDGIHHSTEGVTTTTQGMGLMYRTKREALRAMRHEKVAQVAAILAALDSQIEAAEAEELQIAQAAE